ncbi:carboxypeptidase regulatory-like domain-containing protein [Halogeometricum borinquense]|uniref:Carboxypeptidase regulatory-like domain-containing protein n=1 Tax=Halogeometricum borinquense TaxID=60847 RepID=A0A6C0UD63_9EURY|nr:carboxypeptidase-like regulatory domain-containing protein [Halogeometricum borinquense]QIB73057.1 carboxypeptidase regulatory-like domain-containing protein [Halogeometricum borinquense]QIQ77543.1 carboxypeptidase regulatory-like domain-containing protein [Halogeometricum borinquense]
MLDELRQFAADDRAIEGLPIRLVIALVVGVATLSVMLNMLSGVQGLAVTELDVKPDPDVMTPGEQDISILVVDPDGDPVEGATVVVKDGTADIKSVVTNKTGEGGTATVTVAPKLRSNQEDGTLIIDVKPPAGSQFVDRRENTNILVVES